MSTNFNKIFCYCNSEKLFYNCCSLFLNYKKFPDNPEQLMRSRYTAYCLNNILYIKNTMIEKALENFNMKEAISHSKKCKWISLKILSTNIEENKIIGYVEFVAEYKSYGKLFSLHEKSKFQLSKNRWYYVDKVF